MEKKQEDSGNFRISGGWAYRTFKIAQAKIVKLQDHSKNNTNNDDELKKIIAEQRVKERERESERAKTTRQKQTQFWSLKAHQHTHENYGSMYTFVGNVEMRT